jgi:hypothetical protein
MVNDHAGSDPDKGQVQSRAEALLECLPRIPEETSLDDVHLALGQLKSLVGWLAREAGIPPDAGTADRSVESPEDRLLERVRTRPRLGVASLEAEAEKVERSCWRSAGEGCCRMKMT